MDFPYGISAGSAERWECFLRICAVQAKRGDLVGRMAMSRIVEAELEAIERATASQERREVGCSEPGRPGGR